MNINFESIEKAWFKPKNIIPVNELINTIEYCGYIDCSSTWDNEEGYEFSSILYYLKEYKIQELKNEVK